MTAPVAVKLGNGSDCRLRVRLAVRYRDEPGPE